MGTSCKQIILIDLDGVLNKYNLVLFTTRNLLTSAKWLMKNKIDKYFYDLTNVKIPCVLQIDDRAICFKGDFDNLLNEIENFEVWYKKATT